MALTYHPGIPEPAVSPLVYGIPGAAPYAVNTWTYEGDGQYVYGSVTVPIANTAGNWLIAVVGWNVSENEAVAFASDPAHNFWQPVAITATGKTYRIAVLACPNALAATQVTFSSSDWVRAPVIRIIEVANMGQGLVADSVTVNYVTGTSISVATTTTAGNDFCLTALASDSAPIFSLNAGWNRYGDLTSTESYGDCQLDTAYQVTGLSPTATWTISGPTPMAAVAVAFQARATAASSGIDPNLPLFQAEVAFGATPGSVSSYPAWTDVTSRLISVDGQRGRTFELNALEAGTCDFAFRNDDGAFSPVNTLSPYYPDVQSQVPIRVLATWQGRTYPVFTGHVVNWVQNYDFNYGMVKAQCADSFEALPQVLIGSGMQAEVAFDKPWGYWPLSDAANGSKIASNQSGRSQDNLYAESVSNFVGTAFGITPSVALAGDTATVWHQTGLSALDGNSFGTALELPADSSFPGFAGGLTAEAWCQASSSQPDGAATFIFCLKNLEAALGASGIIARVGFENTTHYPSVSVVDSGGVFNRTSFGLTSIADDKWHHHALTVLGRDWNYYLDGSNVLGGSITWISESPTSISFDGHCDALGQNNFGNMTLAHCAVYDRVLDTERILAHYESGFPGHGFINEGAGHRISRFLTFANWGTPQQIDDGNSLMQQLNYTGNGYGANAVLGSFGNFATSSANTQNPTGGTQADVAVNDIALSDNGILYVDHGDCLTYKGRWQVYNEASLATFGDQGGSQIPYQGDLEFDYSVQYLYNDVTVTRNYDNATLRVFNPASVQQFKRRVLQITTYTAQQSGNPDLSNLANWVISVFSFPALRVSQLTVDVASAPSTWAQVLQLDMLDPVTINRNAPGQAAISLSCFLLQVNFHIEMDTVTWQYAMAPILAPVLTLDDPVYGIVGNNVLGW